MNFYSVIAGRPCYFLINVSQDDQEVHVGVMHQWMMQPEENVPYAIVEDEEGVVWWIPFYDIQFLKEEIEESEEEENTEE